MTEREHVLSADCWCKPTRLAVAKALTSAEIEQGRRSESGEGGGAGAGLDLDRLARLAEAADAAFPEFTWADARHMSHGTFSLADGIELGSDPTGALADACDPQTVLALVERVRVLEAVAEAATLNVGHWFAGHAHWFDPASAADPQCPLCAALAAAGGGDPHGR